MPTSDVYTEPGYEAGRSREEATKIRSHARKQAFSSPVPRVCAVCGYDVHVEVCHLKPICSFPPKTPLDVINSDKNTTLLCRNCHYEMDTGLIPHAPSIYQLMRKPRLPLMKVLDRKRKA